MTVYLSTRQNASHAALALSIANHVFAVIDAVNDLMTEIRHSIHRIVFLMWIYQNGGLLLALLALLAPIRGNPSSMPVRILVPSFGVVAFMGST
jgi:hypothetical protein